MTEEIGIICHSLGVMAAIIAIVCAWLIYSYIFRHYWIDKTRHELFKVRDALWDYAYEHGVLEDPAYKKVRNLMNGMIRFAHKISLTTIISSKIYAEIESNKNTFWEDLEKSIDSTQSEDLKKELWLSIKKMHFIVIDHIIKTSIVLLVLYLCLTFLAYLARSGLSEKFMEWCNERKSTKTMDSLAYNYERDVGIPA